MKIIIKSEGLYDPQNPLIIMCDRPLEKALDIKDLHVIDIRDQILKQTTMMKGQEWRDNFNIFISTSKGRTASARPPTEVRNRSTNLFSDKETKFTVKPTHGSFGQLKSGIY